MADYLTRQQMKEINDDYEATLQEIFEVASAKDATKDDLDTIADMAAEAIGIESEEDESTTDED